MDAFLFDTAVGPCSLRFAERRITGIELPQIAPRELRARLAAQTEEPPPFVAKAARALARHLAGKPQDLGKLPLALETLAPFQRPVVDHAAALAHLGRADRKLARLIARVGPCRLTQASLQSPFEALAESIVYQQLNGRAAATILGRVVALFKPRRFPRPQDLLEASDELLRSAGLSGGKTRAIKDLAARTLAGEVPGLAALRKMPEEEIVERLTQVRGIGRWTVEMLMMFRLGRPDVLPATDYGVRKGFALLHGLAELPSPSELLAHGEKWRPHRSVASWYLWRATEL